MSTVSSWIEAIRSGNESAAWKLWNRYLHRLTELVCRRNLVRGSAIADEDDIVSMAFQACFEAFTNGRFPDVRHRDDLWQLLVRIAENKGIDQYRGETRIKRGGPEGIRNETSLTDRNGDRGFGGFDQIGSNEPTPEFAAIVAEEFGRLIRQLDEHLQPVALMKFEGYTNKEIAEKIGRSIPTVERRLSSIRKIWEQG